MNLLFWFGYPNPFTNLFCRVREGVSIKSKYCLGLKKIEKWKLKRNVEIKLF